MLKVSKHVAPLIVFALAAIVLVGPANAEIPQMISYQGKVTDDGVPVADDSYDMQFWIYDAQVGGNIEWNSGLVPVDVSGGVFSVLLGEIGPAITLPFDEDYWLLVRFDGVNQTPRQRLTSVGYSYMSSGLAPGTVVSGSVAGLPNAAIVGENTATAGSAYGLQGSSYSTAGRGLYGIASANSGTTYGVFASSASTGGRGVYGIVTPSSGQTYGVHGKSQSQVGRGVYGEASASVGANYGVYGESASTDGRGVYGLATATSGSAYGVHGASSSTVGRGVYGNATAGSGITFGVRGWSSSSAGRGMYGGASAASGETYGVYGEAWSSVGTGVYGLHNATTGTYAGVAGASSSNSSSAVGVLGTISSTSPGAMSAGVRGANNGTGVSGVGVYGSQNGSGYGVYGMTPSGVGVVGYTASGTGVYGLHGAATGTNAGVAGQTNSTSNSAVGVLGTISSTSPEAFSAGVRGINNGTEGNGIGVYGSHEGNGWGVFGKTEGSGWGVYGETPDGRGVCGWAISSSGANYGVYGRSSSNSGVGVFGKTSNGGTAVKAQASGSSGDPIYGVYGQSSNSSTGSALGGYFRGEGTASATNAIFGLKASGYGAAGDITYGVYGYAENDASFVNPLQGEFYAGRFIASYGGAPGTGPRTGVMGEAYGGNSSGVLFAVCGYGQATTDSTLYAGWFWAAEQGTGPRYGVYAKSKGSSQDNATYGVRGEAENTHVLATTYGGYFYAHDVGQGGAGEHYGIYAYEATGDDGAAIWCDGDFTYLGLQRAVIKTSQGHRLLAGTESPESWIEDYGEGTLSGGRAAIAIDPLLLEVMAISAEHPMKVFVQLTSGEPLDLVVRKGLTSFEVVAEDPASTATFDYRVVAKRKGYENLRFEATQIGHDSPNLYPELRAVIADRNAEERREVAARMQRSRVYARQSP